MSAYVTVHDVEAIALAELVIQVIACRKARQEIRQSIGLKTDLKVVKASEFAGRPLKTREESAVDHIIASPIEGAYLLAIRKIGERVFQQGGMARMHYVCDQVVNMDGTNPGLRASILDAHWNGIGCDPEKNVCGWVS
jgi:hypothetical protein